MSLLVIQHMYTHNICLWASMSDCVKCNNVLVGSFGSITFNIKFLFEFGQHPSDIILISISASNQTGSD